MKVYKQFQPLVISEFEEIVWSHLPHRHNHYELIYIKHGSGIHVINENKVPYQTGNIFLIGPDEEHNFEIESLTRFVYIKFTDVQIHQPGSSYGVQQMEYLIKSRETHFSGFSLNKFDQVTVGQIIMVIVSLKDDLFFNEQLIWLQIMTLAVLLQRNMPELKITVNRSRDMQAVFCYLHKNIYTPEKLRLPVIANHFNTTADYIGPYFKRNTGTTLRAYISDYRKTLINQRLKNSNHNLKQIAAEFGLTDESHVRKILAGGVNNIVPKV
jgi:AraC family L-rhamnose operon regulatory protein RhaS